MQDTGKRWRGYCLTWWYIYIPQGFRGLRRKSVLILSVYFGLWRRHRCEPTVTCLSICFYFKCVYYGTPGYDAVTTVIWLSHGCHVIIIGNVDSDWAPLYVVLQQIARYGSWTAIRADRRVTCCKSRPDLQPTDRWRGEIRSCSLEFQIAVWRELIPAPS
jgi:hypothetical protein